MDRDLCCCLVIKSCSTLCDPMGCSLPGSSVHGISQARILEWISISFSRDILDWGIEPASPALAGRFFTTEPPGKVHILLSTLETFIYYFQNKHFSTNSTDEFKNVLHYSTEFIVGFLFFASGHLLNSLSSDNPCVFPDLAYAHTKETYLFGMHK